MILCFQRNEIISFKVPTVLIIPSPGIWGQKQEGGGDSFLWKAW